MPDSRNGRPSRELLVRLGQAACGNALAYLDDVRALVAAGRDVRAFALTVMASEEMAKAFWCWRVLQDPSEEAQRSWSAVTGRGGQHQHRLAVGLALEHVVVEFSPDDETARLLSGLNPGQLFDLRNAAMYAEVANGEIWSPRTMLGSQSMEGLRVALVKSVAAHTVILQAELHAME